MPRLFVNDLTVIDSSVFEPEHGIVGESWILDLVLVGVLNDQSMIFDFGEVKRTVKSWVNEEVDHKLILPIESSNVRVCKQAGIYFFEGKSGGGEVLMSAPESAYCFLGSEQVNINSLTRHIQKGLLEVLPDNIGEVIVSLRHERLQTSWYRYSHGLKKHSGNCQRIAHGHRSQIEIWLEGKRSAEQEERWAERWQNIYLGTREDLVEPGFLSFAQRVRSVSSESHLGFSYIAEQGLFELVLPKSQVEVIDTDTTVECLAHYIYKQLKIELPDRHIKVRAYEGIEKGAEYEG